MVRKRRSWHFYLVLILISAFTLGYLLWNFTPVKDEVNAVIIKKLQPYLGESFLIHDFSIGLNSISFYGIRASDPDKTFSLELDEVQFGLRPLKVFTHGPKPLKLIESISIVSPHLTLYYEDEVKVKDQNNLSLEAVFEEIITNLQKAPEIDHVVVSGGGMDLQMAQNRHFPLLSDLAGRINYRANSQKINVDLAGKFLGADTSAIELDGEVDFSQDKWMANLNLQKCIINSNWPFWPFDFWQINNANLQGLVSLHSNGFKKDSLSFSGDIRFHNFSTTIYDQTVTTPVFQATFDKHKIIINPFDCKVEDGDGHFSGSIPNIFDPKADWKFSFKNYSAPKLYQSHSIFEYLYKGKLSGDATITGPFKNLDINAVITSPDLLYAVVPFNTNRVELQYNTKTKLLTFPKFIAYFFKFRTVGSGTIDFISHQINMNMDSDIDVPESYFSILNRLNRGQVTLNTTFQGDYTTKLFHGLFDAQAHSKDSMLVRSVGHYTLHDQLFKYQLYTEEINDAFEVKGTIHDVFSEANLEMMDVKDFPVRLFTSNPLVSKLMEGRYANFYFAGPYDNLSTKMKIVSKKDEHDVKMEVDTHIWNIFLDDQRFRGNFVAHTYPQALEGNFDVTFSLAGMDTKIYSPNLFSGNLFMSAAADGPFSGKVKIEHFVLEDFLENSPGLSNIFKEGSITGKIDIGGTVENPRLDFNLRANDLVVNRVGYYNSYISGQLENYLLTFDNLWLQLNGDSVLAADFYWDLETDSMQLVAEGKNIESNFIAETIFRDPDVIRGVFDYKMVAAGVMDAPMVYGDAEVRDGVFRNNPFHNIFVSFEDSLLVNGNFWELKDHIGKIRKFVYASEEDYTLETEGYVSLDETGPIDINVNLNGNILAELPRFQPFFIDPKTRGSLFACLKGSRNNFYFDQAKLNIYDGEMSFENTIPKVTNLKVDAELSDASGFFKINYIEGLVDGHWAKISNERSVKVADTLLTPWVLDDIGLNFGILTLETEAAGIPLSFYGMMEEGEYGNFAAYGKTENEKFYFAGPSNAAVARGKLVLYDCRVTFPFIGMYDTGSGELAYDEDDLVIGFLMNMFWDVEVRPGNNNHYFVNMPAYVGEVFMELNIDYASYGMDFFGRFIVDAPSLDSTNVVNDSTLYRDYFRINGEIYSLRGRVEYLDVKFRVERFGAKFNPYEVYPEVYGTAYTTVRTEFSNIVSYNIGTENANDEAITAGEDRSFPLDIFLKLYVIDPVTKKEVSRGRWEDFRFKLETRDDMVGETQEDVLAHLGYSFKNLQYKAGEVGIKLTENFLLRPLFRPIERQLERRFKLDYVRLRSSFTSNLFYLNFQDQTSLLNTSSLYLQNLNYNLDPALALLQSSELSLGKYLLKDVYFTYTGQLVSGFESDKLGVNHTLGVEYRLLYNLLLELELSEFQFDPYYDNIPRDFRLRLRHSFNF